MLGKRIRVLSVLCIALLTASAVSAQRPVRLSLSGAIFSTNLNTETTAGEALRLSGISAGGAATVALAYGARYSVSRRFAVSERWRNRQSTR
jgi:hypothetical protein